LRLPRGLPHHGAKFHVFGVLGALGVAVQHHHAHAADLGHPGFRQQDHVGSFGEAGADQEVAVARDPVEATPASLTRRSAATMPAW
jgi:hypothetical protein